ncbi:hypothetical protein [Niabella aquatica]
MKYIYSYLGSLLIMLLTFAACKKDIAHPVEGEIPLATDIDVDIAVNQELNQVTFTLKNKGVYPVWSFEENSKTVYSTLNGFTKIYNTAGTYSVNIRIGNANGISDGAITKTFTINNSLVDFDKYIGLIAGKESKTWSIARKEPAHLACGPSGSDGTEWWSALPNEKADWGLYDDVLTFTNNMKYTYNPGAGGTVYVNKESSLFSAHNPNNGLDFMAPVSEQTTTYNFIGEGTDVYLTFPSQTLFPYLANNEAYQTPKYKVVGISANKLELVSDNGSIAWHYILTSGGDTKVGGYDPGSDCNFWKTATFTNEFYYAPGWNQIGNPGFSANGNAYQITLPTATSETWQAQVKYLTNMTTQATKNYDFSAVFNAFKDHNNVTVKLVKTGEDGTFFFEEKIKLKAYEDYVFIKTDMPGIDMDKVSLVLDFGGNAAETVVTMSRVVLKEHSCDDGTVIEGPGEDNVNWLPNSDCNKWKTVNYTNFFYYAPGWAQIADPALAANGNSYKITLPEATFGQWQAQVHFKTTNISTSSANKYDFYCVLNASKNISGVTVKLTKVDDDNTFFFTKNVGLTAYEDFVLKVPAMDGIDIDKVNLVFDFGGNPANTEITISNIILKESTCNQ